MKHRSGDLTPAVSSMYGWSGAGERWVTYLRTDSGPLDVVGSHACESDAMADAFARDYATNTAHTGLASVWAAQHASLNLSDRMSDPYMRRSADLSDEEYDYSPDEVFDSVLLDQLTARVSYIPGSYTPGEYGDSLPYSPGSMPDRLAVAFRSQNVERTAEEEHEWIRQAQAGDNDAFVRLLSAYSPHLRRRRDRLVVTAGVPIGHAEYTVLAGFTDAVMLFDTAKAAGTSGRLAGGPGASRPLDLIINDAEWDARVEELPVQVSPRSLREFFALLDEANADGSKPTETALRGSSRLSEQDVASLLRWHMVSRLVESDDGDESDSDSVSIGDVDWATVALHTAVPVEQQVRLVQAEAKNAVFTALAALSDVQRVTVIMRFGLDGEEPMSQERVAAVRGISQQAVADAERVALGKMRTALPTKEEA